MHQHFLEESAPKPKRAGFGRLIELDGVSATVAQHAERLGSLVDSIYRRIYRSTKKPLKDQTLPRQPKKQKKATPRTILFDGINGTIKQHASRLGTTYAKAYTAICIKAGRGVKPGTLLGPDPFPRKPCSFCGFTFQPSQRQHSLCSNFCRKSAKAASRRKSQKRKKKKKIPHPEFKFPVLSPCSHCGTLFKPSDKGQRFCSNKCCGAARRKPKRSRRRPPSQYLVSHAAQCDVCQRLLPTPRPPNMLRCSKRCKSTHEWRRRKSTPHLALRGTLRGRLKDLLKKRGLVKTNSITKYLGCTPQELAQHIESQFLPGMSFHNYGVDTWHVDHILPCAWFDLTQESHLHLCFHHLNLRPLWRDDNALKQDYEDTAAIESLPQWFKDKLEGVGMTYRRERYAEEIKNRKPRPTYVHPRKRA